MNISQFSVPIEQRYFEDYAPGAVFEFGSIGVEEAEIIAFARQFDPQAMHVDPQEAARGPFKGLIASGWHTTGLMMRLFIDHYLSKVASLASPGVDEIRWFQPVRPGDVLRIRVSVVEAKPSSSKPDRGMVRSFVEVLNQRAELVMSMKAMNLLRRKAEART